MDQTYANILEVLRRRVHLILLAVLVATVAAFTLSSLLAKRYTATSALVFNTTQLSALLAGLAPTNGNNQQAQQNTNAELVQLGQVAEKTAVLLGEGWTAKAVREAIGVSTPTESNIVDVNATATSPALAARVANVYTGEFIREQQQLSHQYYSAAITAVRKQLGRGSPGTLPERAAALNLLAELPFDNVQIAQAAPVPTLPSSPKTSRNTLLGGFFGLLLGLGVAFLVERMDRRVLTGTQLEKAYGVPLLGIVPESRALSDSARIRRHNWQLLPPTDLEAFNVILIRLRSLGSKRGVHTVVVSSANGQEGSTTVASRLALAAARMGARVLLVEADLRHPSMARLLEARAGAGLPGVLSGETSFAKATQTLDLEVQYGLQARQSMDVLLASDQPPANPTALIESSTMGELVEEARAEYDLVVFDTPPLDTSGDAFALLGKVDGLIVVGLLGRSLRDVAERTRETLSISGARVLGVVANGAVPAQNRIASALRDYLGRRSRHERATSDARAKADEPAPATRS